MRRDIITICLFFLLLISLGASYDVTVSLSPNLEFSSQILDSTVTSQITFQLPVTTLSNYAQITAFTAIQASPTSSIVISLKSPTGSSITLSSKQGGSNKKVFDGTTWSDSAAKSPAEYSFSSDTPVPNLKPQSGLFSSFANQNANGNWVMSITISGTGLLIGLYSGILKQWSVTISDGCLGNPCLHGTCTSTSSSAYTCSCDAGYKGKNCDTDQNECSGEGVGNLCSVNGLCTNTVGSFTCTCKNGYTGDGFTCTDRNECSETPAPCSTYANCTNTPGSFTCVCKTGFSGNGFTCNDINECNSNPCSPNGVCQNSVGSFTCTCKTGYAGNGFNCTDIDECNPSSPCGDNTVCTNTQGSYLCGCSAGYKYDEHGACVDIDECSTSNDCSPYSNCTNSQGSYACSCIVGYSGNGFVCNLNLTELISSKGDTSIMKTSPDTNFGTQQTLYINSLTNSRSIIYIQYDSTRLEGKCLNYGQLEFKRASKSIPVGNGIDSFITLSQISTEWDEYSITWNSKPTISIPPTPGSNFTSLNNDWYSLQVPLTYLNNPYQRTLSFSIELDNDNVFTETEFYSKESTGFLRPNLRVSYTVCGAHSYCENSVCVCENGYAKNTSDTCESLNFCNESCSPFSMCISFGDASKCVCKAGFYGDGFSCIDYNECNGENGGSSCDQNAYCTNTNGSYTCDCQAGFYGKGLAGTCIDFNECNGENGGYSCGQYKQCVNTPGSYRCDCMAGFQTQGNNCLDYNECLGENGGFVCKSNSYCVNTPGSYSCQCNTGYTLNQTICQDYDECIENVCQPNAYCINTIGSYSCECNSGFYEDEDETDCIDYDECQQENGGYSCGANSTCLNTPGSYECACRNGFQGDGETCIECSHNTYDNGNHTCQSCPPYSTSPSGSYLISSCTCNRGYIFNSQSQLCELVTCSPEISHNASWPSSVAGKNATGQCSFGYYIFISDIPNDAFYSIRECTLNEDGKSASWGTVFVGCEPSCVFQECLNDGLCVVPISETEPRCFCRGYSGRYCEFLENMDCNTLDCVHGICRTNSSNDNIAYCDCSGSGYEGDYCQTDVNDCLSNPCMHGICHDNGPNAYICDCEGTGYGGQQCQADINDCSPDPCLNGGVCRDNGPNSFVCDCSRTGYEGLVCSQDINDCDPNPCSHDGICTDLGANKFSCDCSGTGYAGVRCQASSFENADFNFIPICVFIGYVILLIIGYFVLRKFYPDSKNAIFLTLGFAFSKIITHILFATNVQTKDVGVLPYAIAFIVAPALFNLVSILVIFFREIREEAAVEKWLERNYTGATIFTLLSAIHIEIFNIFDSFLFEKKAFQARFREKTIKLVSILGVVGIIIQDCPLFALQIYVVYQTKDGWNPIVVLSIVSTAISIIFGFLKRLFMFALVSFGAGAIQRRKTKQFNRDDLYGLEPYDPNSFS